MFHLVFANITILSRFFLFFLIIDLQFLIYAVVAQISNPTAEFVILAGTLSTEGNAEIETHLLTAKTKTKIFSK